MASRRIDDGFKTIISFQLAPSIKFWEKTITPPSVIGGGENDTTTMRNDALRTKAPKLLKTMGNMTGTCAYDPTVYTDIFSMINVNQVIRVTFPDNSYVEFYGWLDEFTPGELAEGSQPTADFTIIASNQNEFGAETPPVVVSG